MYQINNLYYDIIYKYTGINFDYNKIINDVFCLKLTCILLLLSLNMICTYIILFTFHINIHYHRVRLLFYRSLQIPEV